LIFRAVSSRVGETVIQESNSMNLGETYCKYIIDNDLPQVINDTAQHDISVSLPVTQMIPIKSHISVPIHREDGSIFGMFCCIGQRVNPNLSESDVELMKDYAEQVASKIQNISIAALTASRFMPSVVTNL